MFVLAGRSAKHQLDVVRDVELQSSSDVCVDYLNLVQQSIQNKRHVVEQAFLAGLVALVPAERTRTDHQLSWVLGAEVVNFYLLGDEVAVIPAHQLGGIEIDYSACYYVFLDNPDLELAVKQVHKGEAAVDLAQGKHVIAVGKSLDGLSLG